MAKQQNHASVFTERISGNSVLLYVVAVMAAVMDAVAVLVAVLGGVDLLHWPK